jgi:phage terminase large subunit-like protein
MGRRDLYFLLRYLLNRPDTEHPWLFDRCREVQASPDGHLDLWARGHYKSTIITFALTIQDILNDPEVTFGFFSHTRPIAKSFLRQIKGEFEQNTALKALYDDVLWENPSKEAPKWSEDDGIVVKRKGNPKESTIEAWGLVDGQPTGRHFKKKLYDDVVTVESVGTAEMIQKTTERWGMSMNLGSTVCVDRYAATRYHKNDTYRHMIDIGAVKPRIYAATDNGREDGNPVFLSRDQLAKKRRDMGPYIFGAQMLQNPTADAKQGFQEEWLHYWPADRWSGLNVYLIVDPANAKKTARNHNPDYTAFEVVGLGADNKYRTIWHARMRLNLKERTDWLFKLHRKFRPIKVGYEQTGKDSDIQHIKYVQERDHYEFDIVALAPGGHKLDMIKKLVPIFEAGRWLLPQSCLVTNDEGLPEDMTHTFVNFEYHDFPVASHDDMWDSKRHVLAPELGAEFPMIPVQDERPEWLKRLKIGRPDGSAMSA